MAWMMPKSLDSHSKTRFGGNANSKKMQKLFETKQFEAFTISSKESLEKGYDRYQKLLSQLDALGAGVSDEDANHKFLRSLPPAWDSLAMTMRTEKNIDTLSIDGLYNNLSVFEQDIQKTSSSSLTSDNISSSTRRQAVGQDVDEKCMWHLIREKSNESIATIWAFCKGSASYIRSDQLGRKQDLDDELNPASMAFTVNNENRKLKLSMDKDALQKIVDSWFASSRNLWKLIDCGMSSTIKIGLGYGIQSNAEVLGYEEEMSKGIFLLRETDAGYYDIPLYSRFKQVEYKGVPHPLSGDLP
ncbi:hypothetical protein Tco_0979718 [Tanacetum coccineum]